MELTYDENVDILDLEYFEGSSKGYTLPPGKNENSDISLMLKSLIHRKIFNPHFQKKSSIDSRIL